MDLRSVTPVILTFNEEPNISRTLAALDWASDVVVVDSCSTDQTVKLAEAHARVRVVERQFDAHAIQWNFAVGQTGISTEWILAMDADYVLTPELIRELEDLDPDERVVGYTTRFVYCVDGRRLRGSLYPPVTTLFRRGRGEFRQDGHTHRFAPAGPVGVLQNVILHDDRKSVGRWLAAQNRYMELEAEKLASASMADLGLPDRIRKAVFVAPFVVFLYVLFIKGTVFDGRAGLYYALQRSVAEMILSLHLLQRRLRR